MSTTEEAREQYRPESQIVRMEQTSEESSRNGAGTDSAAVVDAAFARYAREASNYAGGVARERHSKPD